MESDRIRVPDRACPAAAHARPPGFPAGTAKMEPMTALDDLLELLDVEAIEVNLFRGVSPEEDRVRVFGGQVAAQALVSAGRTVPAGRRVHSLHAYFLRPGDPKVPILYQVDRIRDGGSFTTRRTVAIQHGEAIFHLSASFHVDEEGPAHQRPMPAAPDPDTLPTFGERYGHLADRIPWVGRPRPIDSRTAGDRPNALSGGTTSTPREPRQQVWFRPDGPLPDDPLVHACVVAYASDQSLLDSIFFAHGYNWDSGTVQGASLDHAMWFHRPFRADQWLLYDTESPASFGALGLARGEIYTCSGDLVVSVVQEGLIRPIHPGARR
jgi:acyl-CoA thioesterase-2